MKKANISEFNNENIIKENADVYKSTAKSSKSSAKEKIIIPDNNIVLDKDIKKGKPQLKNNCGSPNEENTLPHTRNNKYYGASEESFYNNEVLSGAAVNARIEITDKNVIQRYNPDAGRSLVKERVSESAKDFIKPSQAAIYAEKTWGNKDNEKNGFVKNVGKTVVKGFESAINADISNGNLSSKSLKTLTKHGYTLGKYALLGGSSFIIGSYRMGRYANALNKDVKSGIMTKKEARATSLKRTGKSIVNSNIKIASSFNNSIKQGVKNFKGSDDIGVQSLSKPKDVYVNIRRINNVVNKLKGSTKKGKQKLKKKAQKKAQKQAARQTTKLGRTVHKTKQSFMAVKSMLMFGGGMVFGVLILIVIIAAVVSIFSSGTIKSDYPEYTSAYLYITELDADLTDEIRDIKDEKQYEDIDQIHYYVNGVETSSDNIAINTDADSILLYLDSKYEEYEFESIKTELTDLYENITYYKTKKWEEEVVKEHEELTSNTSLNDNSSKFTSSNESTNEESEETEIIYHLDVTIELKDFYTYIIDNGYLTNAEQKQYETMKNIGQYTMINELGNPFKNNIYKISSRWGWNINRDTGEKELNNGLEIAISENTEVNNVMFGTVTKVVLEDATLGNYVSVTKNKNVVTYAYLNSISVSEGQVINKGDIIGNTGKVFHIEYKKDETIVCPAMYLVLTSSK